jgi:hypothetical protein
MKIFKTRNLSLFGILILIVFNISKANACSCDTTSLENALEFSDEIFTGKVVKVEEYKNGQFVKIDNEEKASYPLRYYFEVERKWKGNQDSILIVGGDNWSCDFWFDIGKRYLVYATRDTSEEEPIDTTAETIVIDIPRINDGKDILSTWLCSRTTHEPIGVLEKNNWYKKDLRRLNKKFLNEPDKINPNKLITIEEQPNDVDYIQKTSNRGWLMFVGILIFIILFAFRRKRIE